ncbi:MAG TPA: ATP-binding cassette domain-containing protein [Kofleriaceae bacterium]|jgi:phospholipid/cholesterol/gamma-HCH transport system ATP-binding protein|nr:ATP-binding cassette domain-containing protein [Kofleriaceae bacterium]
MTAISVDGVTKRFGSRRVLDGVSFAVEPGARLGVIGPAAGGKSVLLKILAGLVAPDAGRALVRGAIGMLFQNSALFDFLNVFDNVAFPLVHGMPPRGGAGPRPQAEPSEPREARMRGPGVAPRAAAGIDTGNIDQRVRERLRAVGLAGAEHKLPSELSGGMRKRVGLARATVAEPDVVLYDEPTAGLDPVTTSKIYELLRGQPSTAIVVSSDVEAVAQFADTIAYLDEGRIQWLGPAHALFHADDPRVRRFATGEAA